MGAVEFTCRCGFEFLNSTDNRSYVSWLLADQDFDAFFDLIDDAVEKSGPTSLDKERAVMELRASLFAKHSRIWQCEKCGIVYISDTPRDLFAGRGIELKRVVHRNDR